MFGTYFRPSPSGETVFTVDPRPLAFGPGAIAEIAHLARRLGMSRIALFTDPVVAELAPTARGRAALTAAGLDVAVYAEVAVEPSDRSFAAAADFLGAGDFDGVISIGGGSVIDTAKAANLYATYPADILTYVNAPIGEGRPVPGPVRPHLACPTTAGTGSEATGVAVFDLAGQRLKTGISSNLLKPSAAIIDPEFTYTVPSLVTAATGFDVLTHAIESYTAIPYTDRQRPAAPADRPPYQGANPYSDMGSLEAIRIGARYLLRAAMSPDDHEARIAMSYAATLAGSSFGNAGVHLPHAMSYSVAGMIRDYRPNGWPDDHPMCPHGISVVVNAPAAFALTGPSAPQRHLEVARALGVDTSDVADNEAGLVVANSLIGMMCTLGVPNGLTELGYSEADIPELVAGALRQRRLLRQAPLAIGEDELSVLYRAAMRYW
ncbi:MAG: hydroxyacid-oxoacid transhydrogenase [Myxococcota bacterium]